MYFHVSILFLLVYTFIYYWFSPSKISNKIGVIQRDDWEWAKSNVIIERLP